MPAETQPRTNYSQSVTRSPSSLGILTRKLCFFSFPCEPASRLIRSHISSWRGVNKLCNELQRWVFSQNNSSLQSRYCLGGMTAWDHVRVTKCLGPLRHIGVAYCVRLKAETETQKRLPLIDIITTLTLIKFFFLSLSSQVNSDP